MSDSTGETLTTIAKAASVQYALVRPIEHVHPLVRTARQMKRVLQEIEQTPGIVLYTITNRELREELERRCIERLRPTPGLSTRGHAVRAHRNELDALQQRHDPHTDHF